MSRPAFPVRAALSAAIGIGIAAALPAAPLALTPCEIPGVSGTARCGVFEVFEDRGSRAGRKIALKIVVLPATGPAPAPDPLVFLEGGPGASATEDAAGLAKTFEGIRERRDILLVDQRGTGGSNPLNCKLFEPADVLQSYLGAFFPLEAAQRCRPELERSANLTLYTTPIAADDLDDVRAALGYERLNLLGASYGTRAALVYLRRHGAHVRTAILHGVSPTNQDMPLHFPADTERALQGVLAECAAEAACRAAFPDSEGDLSAALSKLAVEPASVDVVHPETGAPARVRLSRDVVAETVRYMLYFPAAAGYLPAAAHAAAQGDFAPLAEMALFLRRNLVGSGSNGMYLSVTCAEDLPWVREADAERVARGTMLGDYRYREQSAACAIWPRGPLPGDYRSPIRSKVPVLIVSGAWDPVTPPSSGTVVARTLSNSLHVIVPHGGHSFDGLRGAECIDRLDAEFLERGTTAGLDTRCVARVERPPFATVPLPRRPIAMTAAELERFAGAYTAEGSPDARVSVGDGFLVLEAPGESRILLLPVAANRFRVVAQPLAECVFADGKAVLEDSGQVQQTRTRKGS